MMYHKFAQYCLRGIPSIFQICNIALHRSFEWHGEIFGGSIPFYYTRLQHERCNIISIEQFEAFFVVFALFLKPAHYEPYDMFVKVVMTEIDQKNEWNQGRKTRSRWNFQPPVITKIMASFFSLHEFLLHFVSTP